MASAVEFLREHGSTALVSLGSGSLLNRIDNHLRLFLALGLTHYVAVDAEPRITADMGTLFDDDDAMFALLASHYGGEDRRFLEVIRMFPETWIEELVGIHCSVVVCQRVLPYLHWEETICSMRPHLVLQEDLHGCELQNLGGAEYQRYRSGIRSFGLKPFRPWRILPGEKNMILWKRKDSPWIAKWERRLAIQ